MPDDDDDRQSTIVRCRRKQRQYRIKPGRRRCQTNRGSCLPVSIAEQDHAHDGQVVESNPFLFVLFNKPSPSRENPARLFRHDALCHRTLTNSNRFPFNFDESIYATSRLPSLRSFCMIVSHVLRHRAASDSAAANINVPEPSWCRGERVCGCGGTWGQHP